MGAMSHRRYGPPAAARPFPPDWEERRAAVLARDVLCTDPHCKRLSVDVDHTVARALGGSDDPSNLQGKCRIHHGQKTARERRGDVFGYVYGEES
jgi:5-methylcytosine-specific restriction endonuclease McrA